jgi:hypothetical protein
MHLLLNLVLSPGHDPVIFDPLIAVIKAIFGIH